MVRRGCTVVAAAIPALVSAVVSVEAVVIPVTPPASVAVPIGSEPIADQSGCRTGETGEIVAETVVTTAAIAVARTAAGLPARERRGGKGRSNEALSLVAGRTEPIVVIPASHLRSP